MTKQQAEEQARLLQQRWQFLNKQVRVWIEEDQGDYVVRSNIRYTVPTSAAT